MEADTAGGHSGATVLTGGHHGGGHHGATVLTGGHHGGGHLAVESQDHHQSFPHHQVAKT